MLARLYERDYRVSELADGLCVGRPSLTVTAEHLVRRGLIERCRELPNDRRAVLLRLTPAGHAVYRALQARMIDVLAELLALPISAIRHWHRRGTLHAAREVRRLPYFDFEEVRVARKLAQLLAAGCSLTTVSRQLAELNRLLPDVPRPLAGLGVTSEAFLTRISTTRTPVREVTPEVADARRFEERLEYAAAHGSFLALKVRPKLMLRAERELAARFRLASEPAAELAKALPAVSQAELASAPAVRARSQSVQ